MIWDTIHTHTQHTAKKRKKDDGKKQAKKALSLFLLGEGGGSWFSSLFFFFSFHHHHWPTHQKLWVYGRIRNHDGAGIATAACHTTYTYPTLAVSVCWCGSDSFFFFFFWPVSAPTCAHYHQYSSVCLVFTPSSHRLFYRWEKGGWNFIIRTTHHYRST